MADIFKSSTKKCILLWFFVLSNLITCVLQHTSLALLKEMLFALDLAVKKGTDDDKKSADRLQRRYNGNYINNVLENWAESDVVCTHNACPD